YQGLKAGRVSRRAFMAEAAALGVGLPIALFVVNSVRAAGAAAAPRAQDAPALGSARPTAGTEGQQRGPAAS
ncbi:MAG: hypothetical protein QOF33_429, partial [Thermomicrobiales bacterium]|nr:hypothetical protein [Thermomicrobiales bacterium]